MIKPILSLTLLATSFTLSAAPPSPIHVQEVEDLSNLPLKNPDLAMRKTAKLCLGNGLEALLISDPGADQSAAAIAVEAGSWNDPAEHPGMAHFCEHMLFMGTQKYPSENEFFTMISNYAGKTNAYTAPDRTVYMFSAQEEGFLAILDRFAHFFIDPLFNPANIAREMHAVDQEFAKNIENDRWREYMIFKETGNPNHPNHMFSTGNSETLSHIPQEALKKWHRSHYLASKMHLAIYSPLPLEKLKETVIATFSAIPNPPPLPNKQEGPLTSAEQRGSMIYIKPIQNQRLLSLAWELPSQLSDDATKSASLVAYALQRGQKYSLYEKLKEEELIDDMSIQVDDMGGKEHRFFQITLELSQKGIEQTDTVILRCFEAIAGLKTTGVPEYLFRERNAITQLNYQYQSRRDAFEYIMDLGDSLLYEPLSTFPRNSLLATQYSPQTISQALSTLTPETCIISLMASPELTKVLPDHKEKWFGAEYAIRPLPAASMKKWTAAMPNPAIRLADPNPFLPTHLEIIADHDLGQKPIAFANIDLGSAYYVRSPEFAAPKSVYHLHILSPEINGSAKSAVLASLYLDHLTDLLHPTLAAASAAGLSCGFELERLRLHLQIGGFSEKVPLLLQEIVKQMPLNPPTAAQFALYTARHERGYLNAQKDLAAVQAKELLSSLLNQGKPTKLEKLEALRQINYEEFLIFHKKLLEKIYIEALFAGNLSLKEAESAWLDLLHVLGKAPFLKKDQPPMKALHLNGSGGPYFIQQSTSAQGNASLLLIDEGTFTFEKRAVQELLSAILKEAFFNELRTKQKTGYIATSDCTELENELFQYFLVQSNSHQPEDLLYRFELFLEQFNESLAEQVPQERFNTLKQSLISSLKTRFRNLREKSALWDLLAFQRGGDFNFIEKRVQALEALKYEEFIPEAIQFLARDNHKRLAILFEGKLNTPFAYQKVAPTDLSNIATYESRPEKEEDSPQSDEAVSPK